MTHIFPAGRCVGQTVTIIEQVYLPLMDGENMLLSWQGVRADESLNRRYIPECDEVGGQRLHVWHPDLPAAPASSTRRSMTTASTSPHELLSASR